MLLTGDYTVGIWDTLWPIAYVLLFSVLFYVFRETIQTTPLKRWIPILMLGLMIVFEIGYFVNVALLFSRPFTTSAQHLPLHMCGSSAILVMLYLGFRKKVFLDILVLQGIIGAIVTFIFPDITDFPFEYNYIRFFLSHGLLLLVPMYAIIVEKYRVTRRNLVIGLIFIHCLAVIATIVNFSYDTYYLYISKDNSHNLFAFLPLLDTFPFLGTYPWVLVLGELLAIPVYTLVYVLLKKFQTKLD